MKAREELESLGNRIWNASRTELYLAMHFLGAALGSLNFRMDLSTKTVGTDAVWIRFNPSHCLKLYVEHPEKLNRTYMHMLLHCLFRHMFSAKEYADVELWDLCCDITVESVLDSMECEAFARVSSDFRQQWYETLGEELNVLTAEKLYHYFSVRKRDAYLEESLRQEFALCDHSFWQRLQSENEQSPSRQLQNPEQPIQPQEQKQEQPSNPLERNPELESKDGAGVQEQSQKPNAKKEDKSTESTPLGAARPKEEEWKEHAKRVKSDLESYAKDTSTDKGQLLKILRISTEKRTGYQEYLKRFAILREEISVDLDSFDYGYYMYGLSLYNNLPLIEENEFCEKNKIEELVIAIDTSASCQGKLVRQFLKETCGLLMDVERFFGNVKIHILECDNQMQKDVKITKLKELESYADHFEVAGGYGTDFRPVFSHVEKLRKSGELKRLKGLLYFTDGYGIFPKKPTDYDTAFVFWNGEDAAIEQVPDWAMKLFFDTEGKVWHEH